MLHISESQTPNAEHQIMSEVQNLVKFIDVKSEHNFKTLNTDKIDETDTH